MGNKFAGCALVTADGREIAILQTPELTREIADRINAYPTLLAQNAELASALQFIRDRFGSANQHKTGVQEYAEGVLTKLGLPFAAAQEPTP